MGDWFCVWVYRCMSMQVCECGDVSMQYVWVCRCVSIQVYEYAGMWVYSTFECTGVHACSMNECTGRWVCIGVWMCSMCASVWMCRYVISVQCMSMHCVKVQVCECAGMWMFNVWLCTVWMCSVYECVVFPIKTVWWLTLTVNSTGSRISHETCFWAHLWWTV